MSEHPQIICRAFDEEPVVLYALEMQTNGHHVNVSREFPPAKHYIGWPISDAFDYDVDSYTELRTPAMSGRSDG